VSAEPVGDPLAAADGATVLGPGAHFEGLLTFRGRARVDGSVAGEIAGHGLLVLGPGARAEANVEVDELVVAGEIEGDVRARRRVELLATGLIRGDVETPRLVIAEGGRLLGRCTTGPAARALGAAPPAPLAPPRATGRGRPRSS
jgi:cytoskeletal protein CcmA (bactofilin family)